MNDTKSKKYKLLYLVTEDWYFYSHRFELAKAAINAGYEVYLVTQVSNFSEIITAEGIKLIPIVFPRSFRRPWQDVKTLIKIFKIYRTVKPDMVHHVALKPVLFGSLVCMIIQKNSPRAVVNAMTGLGSLFLSKKFLISVLRRIFKRVLMLLLQRNNSYLIVQNHDDAELFSKTYEIDDDHISLIRGSGVDVRSFKPKYGRSKIVSVVLVGRMLKDKGVGEFINAVSILKKEGVTARFVLVGDSDPENPSAIPTHELQNWHDQGLVEWWGRRDDMVDVYRQADIVVLPSYREGLPKVLLEAAASGLPIVTTEVPGCKEVVKHGVNGLLVPVEESTQLAEAILTLINNPEMCQEMGIKGRELVERELSSDRVINDTLNLYRSLQNKVDNKQLTFFVTEDWYFYSHRLNLAITAAKAGFDVSAIVRVMNHGKEIENAGIKLLPIELSRKSMNPYEEFKTLFSVYQFYKMYKPDIVHHVALKPILYGTIAAKLAGTPSIINAFAGLGWLFSSNELKARLLKNTLCVVYRVLLKNTYIIVQNPDDLNVLKNLGLRNISLINGAGVDMNVYEFQPESISVPLVILPSRLIWTKGVGLFVNAAKIIKDKGIDARFALVGQPDSSNPSSIDDEQLNQWHEEQNVEVWGQRNDMPDVYAQSHIVCLPTTYGEGVPKALIEAAASGRAIITTDAPGCREIVIDQQNGFLIEPENIDMLVARLETLIMDSKLRQAMGKKGRTMVKEKFSDEKVFDETLSLYKEVKVHQELNQTI